MAARYSSLAIDSLYSEVSGGNLETRLRAVETGEGEPSDTIPDPDEYHKGEQATLNSQVVVEVYRVGTSFDPGGFRNGIANTECVVRVTYQSNQCRSCPT